MRLSWIVPVMIGLAAPVAVVAGVPSAALARPACDLRPAGQVVTLHASDTGRSVCAHRGARIEVVLQVDLTEASVPEQWWQPVELTGQALTVLPQTMMPTRGTTLAAYSAAAHGTATLSSSRRPCAPPPPGGVTCMMIAEWSVTVTVR